MKQDQKSIQRNKSSIVIILDRKMLQKPEFRPVDWDKLQYEHMLFRMVLYVSWKRFAERPEKVFFGDWNYHLKPNMFSGNWNERRNVNRKEQSQYRTVYVKFNSIDTLTNIWIESVWIFYLFRAQNIKISAPELYDAYSMFFNTPG